MFEQSFEKSSFLDEFWNIINFLQKFKKSSILSEFWKIIIFCQNLKNHHFLQKFEKSSILDKFWKIINFCQNLKNRHFWRTFERESRPFHHCRLLYSLLYSLLNVVCWMLNSNCCDNVATVRSLMMIYIENGTFGEILKKKSWNFFSNDSVNYC